MFVAVDESLEYPLKTISAVCLPLSHLISFEKKWLKIRINNKVWAEIKWEKITKQYVDKYKKFIDLFFSSQCTFHCWAYRSPSASIVKKYFRGDSSLPFHTTAYNLLKNLSRKIERHYGEECSDHCLYVVADKGSRKGEIQWKKTNEFLSSDRNVPLKVEFCDEGNSAICSLIQIADLLGGCASIEINDKESKINKYSKEFLNYVKEKTGGEIFIETPVAEWGRFKFDCFIQKPGYYEKK